VITTPEELKVRYVAMSPDTFKGGQGVVEGTLSEDGILLARHRGEMRPSTRPSTTRRRLSLTHDYGSEDQAKDRVFDE
jgi:cytochrome c-type biogenesis protein CcmE